MFEMQTVVKSGYELGLDLVIERQYKELLESFEREDKTNEEIEGSPFYAELLRDLQIYSGWRMQG